jgi:hypothetical protein
MDYGHSHTRDVYWTKHALHRIKQSGGTLEFMSETLAVSPQITLPKKALSKKHKYSKYRKDQQSFCWYWHSVYRTLFTCKKENGKLIVITVTQK